MCVFVGEYVCAVWASVCAMWASVCACGSVSVLVGRCVCVFVGEYVCVHMLLTT